MPISPERKNAAVVVREMRQNFQNRTNINSYTTDSKSRALLDIMSDQVVEIRNRQIDAFNATQLGRARGTQLDEIGRGMGVPRLLQRFCEANASERTFAFYVATGTFGDLNGGGDFVIPAGTIVSSNPNQNEFNTAIEYEITVDVTCNADSSLAYANVRAVNSGSASRIGYGILTNHNFTGISAASQVLCTNFYAILNGRDDELDDAYRFRLASERDRLISSNDSRTRLESLRIPGVVDVRIVPGYFGVGSTAVAVLGSDYNSNPKMVQGVQSVIHSIYTPGSYVQAIPAPAVFFDLELKVKLVRPITTSEQQQVSQTIRRACFNYFRTVDLGGTVDLTLLAYDIQQATNGLIQLRDTRNTNTIFEKVYIRKGSDPLATTERERLIQTSYVLDQIEYCDLGTFDIVYTS